MHTVSIYARPEHMDEYGVLALPPGRVRGSGAAAIKRALLFKVHIEARVPWAWLLCVCSHGGGVQGGGGWG